MQVCVLHAYAAAAAHLPTIPRTSSATDDESRDRGTRYMAARAARLLSPPCGARPHRDVVRLHVLLRHRAVSAAFPRDNDRRIWRKMLAQAAHFHRLPVRSMTANESICACFRCAASGDTRGATCGV
ncbi:MAG: hypothetical protein EOO65_02560 [Methanosarcinales archaeon]|nr:MAG: hypothetical protein EOO65_02560 [Methanosarcinales archaeon]